MGLIPPPSINKLRTLNCKALVWLSVENFVIDAIKYLKMHWVILWKIEESNLVLLQFIARVWFPRNSSSQRDSIEVYFLSWRMLPWNWVYPQLKCLHFFLDYLSNLTRNLFAWSKARCSDKNGLGHKESCFNAIQAKYPIHFPHRKYLPRQAFKWE